MPLIQPDKRPLAQALKKTSSPPAPAHKRHSGSRAGWGSGKHYGCLQSWKGFGGQRCILRSEAVPWWFNISFTSQPHWGEDCGLHLAQLLHPPEATRDRWHWPSCTGCFWLYWPWGHRFPQSCPILLFRYYLSSRIVAELQHVFYSPYVLLFGQ